MQQDTASVNGKVSLVWEEDDTVADKAHAKQQLRKVGSKPCAAVGECKPANALGCAVLQTRPKGC